MFISAGKGMLIFNIGPLIQAIFGWAILKEKIGWIDVAAPLVAFGGVGYMVYHSEKTELGRNEPLGILLIFISALLSGAIAV